MAKTVIVPTGGMMGGACGYGMGYGGFGIPPIGMVGVWGNGGWGGCGGRDGYGGGYGGGGAYPAALIGGGRIEGNVEREIGILSDNMNSRFNDINGDVRTARIEGSIGGVNNHLGHMSDRQWTTALSDKDMYWQGVVTQKDCCCQQKEIAMAEGCKTRQTICDQEEKTRAVIILEAERNRGLMQRYEDERKNVAIVDLKGENSNLKQTAEIEAAIRRNRDECFGAINGLFGQVSNLSNQVAANNKDVLNNFGTLTSTVSDLSNSMQTT